MEVGLGPGEFVFDGDPATPRKKAQPPHPIFGPRILWPNGWMDQDATWYGGKCRPRRRCVRWGRSFPPPKRGTAPQFSVHVYCCQTVGWILEDATWYGSRSRSRPHCIGLGLSSPWQGHSSSLFSAHIYCTVAHLSCCWARFLFPSMRLPCMYATVAVKYN